MPAGSGVADPGVPIYEQKRYLEAWGPEAHDALERATHMAPIAVAKFFSYWTRQILDPTGCGLARQRWKRHPSLPRSAA